MTSKEIFDSSKESEVFDFTMRTTSNDLKRVNTYGDASYISTDQELPYDNEKDELSSVEIFVAGIMESMILTIIREAKIARAELDEIEGRASVRVTNPLRTLKVIGVEESPIIENIKIKIYYYIDDFTHEEGEKFMRKAIERDPVYQGVKKGFEVEVEFLFQL
ncbi:MAG: OsmC family protein [Ezakiella coagulans]|uniref:OsmC family protein n=1 Tax=Ezakiella coagulans TaxID=46507 RepID=UPI00399BA2AB